MGFLKPDSGRVIAGCEDITDLSEEELDRIHKKVTMVFQSGALFDSLSVWKNVAFLYVSAKTLMRKRSVAGWIGYWRWWELYIYAISCLPKSLPA